MARRAGATRVTEEEVAPDLLDDLAQFYDMPLEFVFYVFPWGEPGVLSSEEGPDDWQVRVLHEIGERVRAGQSVGEAVRVAVASGHGIGKALAHGTPVLDWNRGWVPVEHLAVGDMVISVDGQPTRITGVFPQGERELFRVTLDDGTWVDVDGDHRWFTTTRSERKHGKAGGVRTTREIAASLTFPNGPTDGLNHQLPTVSAVKHPTALLPIDPYLLGCWLGDGSAKGRITGEAEQFEVLAASGVAMGKECRDSRRANVITRTPLGIAAGLRVLGLLDCRAHEKHIPDVYLRGDVSQRTALLQGLLDTDGSISASGALTFEVTAPRLADDCAELVRSLGGVVRRGEKMGGYGGKECRKVYRLFISLPREVAPFRLPAKANRYRPDWGSKNRDRGLRRFIRSVEPMGRGQATCISVAHPSHLFVTKDHIVTHNTALVAWIILWFISTRRNPQIVVTANTKQQLTNKTWRELAKWQKLARHGGLFQWSAEKFYLKGQAETWFASAVPWSKERAEAFAGTHEEHVLLVFDEASAIDDVIWEVAEGAMTTHGAMWICFGNPTRNTGRFRECWRRFAHRWFTLKVDSRTAKKASQVQIEAWREDYGEDSDFFKVRVRGEFPSQSSTQFIDEEAVEAAMRRFETAERLKKMRAADRNIAASDVHLAVDDADDADAPLVVAVDVARFGDDDSVIFLRKGNVARMEGRWNGLSTDQLTQKVAEVIRANQPDAVFVDAIGIGAGVVDQLRALGFDVIEAIASAKALNEQQFYNRRIEMWDAMRKWLRQGGMVQRDERLQQGLTAPEYGFAGRAQQMQLESKDDMKARGQPSPDEADALAMTFYQPVARRERQREKREKLLSQLGLQGLMAGTTHMSH